MPREPLPYIKLRLDATIGVETSIQDEFDWADWPLAAMTPARTALVAKVAAVDALDSTVASIRRSLDKPKDDPADLGPPGMVDDLHEMTREAVGTGKIHFKHDAGKYGRFEKLTGGAQSRPARMKEAELLIPAWQAADAAWSPLPGVTLAALQALYALCQETLRLLDVAESNATEGHKELDALADGILDLLIAWYETITTLYAATTEIGAQVRSEIPTTYSPPAATPPVVPAPA